MQTENQWAPLLRGLNCAALGCLLGIILAQWTPPWALPFVFVFGLAAIVGVVMMRNPWTMFLETLHLSRDLKRWHREMEEELAKFNAGKP